MEGKINYIDGFKHLKLEDYMFGFLKHLNKTTTLKIIKS